MKTFKIICALLALASCGIVFAQESMPKPRAVSDQERAEVLRTLVARFGVPSREKVEVMAAGAFRFAGNAGLTYIERTDLGSSLLERASYGLTLEPIDEKGNSREVLVPKLLELLRKVAPTAETPVFAGFQLALSYAPNGGDQLMYLTLLACRGPAFPPARPPALPPRLSVPNTDCRYVRPGPAGFHW